MIALLNFKITEFKHNAKTKRGSFLFILEEL